MNCYPLTQSQQLIYDMVKFAGGSIANICGSMLFSEKVDIQRLEHAINEIYRINDALRIRIKESSGTVQQYVSDFEYVTPKRKRFTSKNELHSFGNVVAKEPMPIDGKLCSFYIISLPEQTGIIIKLHHLIGDAWTLSLLGTQFNAILHGNTPDAYSFIDHIKSEEKYIESKRYQRDQAFFETQFKSCDEATFLSEKTADSFNAERSTFLLSGDQTNILRDYTNRNGVSLFQLILTAISVYFNRIKMNTEQFYIGTAVLNRAGNIEQNTAGMFINTVPLLIDMKNELSFAENLRAVSGKVFSALRHEKYNYGALLAYLRKHYHFTEKLYDVIFSYQNATVTGKSESTWYPCGMQTESLQIHAEDRDNTGSLQIHYDYLTDKFNAKEIEAIHTHIFNLLFDAINDGSKKPYELNMLSSEEKQKVLYDFNDTVSDYPKDKCVHELIEDQVKIIPDHIAVIAKDKTLTYKELNEEANRIAHSLIEKDVGAGDIVAIILPRNSHLIPSMLGVLKTGAAYLPIDPTNPQDRIEYILSDSNTKYCINNDNVPELIKNPRTNNPGIAISNKQICYCIYTSGSTGLPKGTLLTHKNVVNYISRNDKNVIHGIIDDEIKSIVSITTVGFDIFVTESLLPLANGLYIIFADEDKSRIQSELNDLLTENPADVIQTTPTKITSLIADFSKTDYLKKLKIIILGGEILDPALVKKLRELTTAKIFNIYGPTETTVWVCFAPAENNKDITIGKPIDNTQIYIADKYMQILPAGITGELCIAGDCVGAGYLNRPKLTAEKFIDNPFGDGKLYKTGDLAYWLEDGNIVYVGRNDFQVKIRGLRIELGEIENAISSIDGIIQSVVLVRKNDEGRQLICAFYSGEAKNAKEIRTLIGKRLPKYMLPHIITHIDEMPLTSSGKINRKALPEIDLNNIESAAKYIAPETEQESALVEAIKSVLKLETVSTADNFFDLGGDSLKAIELTSLLEDAGYTSSIKTIFDAETVGSLANKLAKNLTEKTHIEYGNIISATSAQMRVYTAQNMNADSTLYNIPYAFKTDTVDVNRLEKSINKMIARHESLRTHFENHNGKIMQVIDETANISVEYLSSEDMNSFIRPFDLSVSPLMRVGVYENLVFFDFHHIITDGGSIPVFFRELNELYMDRELKTEPVQYGEFAVTPVDTQSSEKYWLSVFNDEIPVLEINTDEPRTDKQSFCGKAFYDTIDFSLHCKIKEKCKALSITPYVFYMGAFSILMCKYSNNEDIVIGMPLSGRSPKYLNTIGMFVNTVALRTKPDGEKSVDDFLQEVRDASISAIDNQNYPFGDLVKKLKIDNSGRNPLFDVMFAYQDKAMTDVIFGDKKVELLPVPVTSSKCDFTFNIMPRNNDVVLMVEYCTDLFKEITISRLAESYKYILEQLV